MGEGINSQNTPIYLKMTLTSTSDIDIFLIGKKVYFPCSFPCFNLYTRTKYVALRPLTIYCIPLCV